MTAMTNYYRWLVGSPLLTEPSVGSDALQKGALVRNFDFNHIVSTSEKPADMDDALWNEGAAASHNILALGYTPRSSIRGWLNEGYSLVSGKWDTIGHRMALLNGDISSVQFGYAGQCAIGKIAARDNALSLPFTAFPAPGDMPLGDINARASAWTAELNPAVLSCGSGAWEPDTENKCWHNTADASLLPDFVTDPDGVLANVTLTWAYPRVPSYTGQLTAVGAKGSAGVNGSIMLSRYMTNLEFAELYQFTQASDGTESAVLRFDSDSPNHALATNKSTFTMEPWRVSDSGDWLGVYYSKTGACRDGCLC